MEHMAASAAAAPLRSLIAQPRTAELREAAAKIALWATFGIGVEVRK